MLVSVVRERVGLCSSSFWEIVNLCFQWTNLESSFRSYYTFFSLQRNSPTFARADSLRFLWPGHTILTKWAQTRADVRGDLTLNTMVQIHTSATLLTSRDFAWSSGRLTCQHVSQFSAVAHISWDVTYVSSALQTLPVVSRNGGNAYWKGVPTDLFIWHRVTRLWRSAYESRHMGRDREGVEYKT